MTFHINDRRRIAGQHIVSAAVKVDSLAINEEWADKQVSACRHNMHDVCHDLLYQSACLVSGDG